MHNFKKGKGKKSVIFTREQRQDINFVEIITYPLMLQKPFYRRHSWYSMMNKDLFFGLLASLTQKNLHPKISLIIGQFIKKKLKKKDIPSLFLSNSQNYFSYILSTCGVWGARVRVQISKRKLHTHIHLDYVRVEILSCKKKKKKVGALGFIQR